MTDGRLKTLRKADPAEVQASQRRYQLISDTIEDTVSKLQKIVDAGEEGLRGKWVDAVKEDAASLKESLDKAAVRYRDVATEIKKYEPDLDRAIVEVDAAERDEADASASLTRAGAMPDPVKGADGTVSPEEQQRGADKQRAQDDASAQVAAAKNRLTGALDALDVAGKRLGDAVNEKNYDDGLTDKISWRIMAVFKKISQIFGIVAMILTALAVMIPGLGALAVAGLVAGAVVLIADSVLLAGGDGSVLAVVLGAFGVAFAGLSLAVGALGKSIEAIAKFVKSFPKINVQPVFKPNGQVIPMINLARPGATTPVEPGFFTFVQGLFGNGIRSGFGALMQKWWTAFVGLGAIRNLSFLKDLPLLGRPLGAMGTGIQSILATWGGLNQAFALGASLIIAGLQATEHHSLKGA